MDNQQLLLQLKTQSENDLFTKYEAEYWGKISDGEFYSGCIELAPYSFLAFVSACLKERFDLQPFHRLIAALFEHTANPLSLVQRFIISAPPRAGKSMLLLIKTNDKILRIWPYAMNRLKPLFYIGKGCKNRMFSHFKQAKNKNSPKNSVIKKYSCYAMPIIGGVAEGFAFKLEEALINLYNMALTNITKGGEGASGLKHSDKTKATMSKKHKKDSLSTKTRFKMSMAKTGNKNHNYGKPMLESTKAKLSIANSGTNNHNYGKKLSIETKAKISIANSGENNARFINREYIAYHLWACAISGLKAKEYCQNKIFTYSTFCSWKCRFKNEQL